MRYAALIPCGPSPLEAERLGDLLDALAFHDPEDCAVTIVLNDANPFLSERIAGHPKCRIVDNPRRGEGWGVGGGLAAGQIWTSERIACEYPEVGCIVKIDTDALPIQPMGSELERIFADPSVGIAGSRIASEQLPSYKITPPVSYFGKKVHRLRAPLSIWRMPHWHFRFAISGHHRWIASLHDQAETHGYIEGELIEGGAYAMSMALIRTLVEAKVTARWRDFIDIPVTEDVIMTMLAYSAGFRAVDTPFFCIEPGTLRYAPSEILADPGVGIVHSLKCYRNTTEAELRKAFREARERQPDQARA